MSRDTYGGSTDDPLSLNLYSFAKDNPQIYVDADGKSPVLSTVLMMKDMPSFAPNPAKMSSGAYFWNVYYPKHLPELIIGIIGVVLVFLGPAFVAVLGGPDRIIAGCRVLVATSLALDLPSLYSDLGESNYAALGSDVVQLVADVIKGYLETLSPLELLEVGLMTIAQSAGTLGWLEAVDTLAGIGAAVILIGTYAANFWYEYNYVYQGGGD